MGYTLDQKEFRNLKSRLTRAKNSGDPAKILVECNRAFAIFEEKGFPDAWHRWNIALDDARHALRRQAAGL